MSSQAPQLARSEPASCLPDSDISRSTNNLQTAKQNLKQNTKPTAKPTDPARERYKVLVTSRMHLLNQFEALQARNTDIINRRRREAIYETDFKELSEKIKLVTDELELIRAALFKSQSLKQPPK